MMPYSVLIRIAAVVAIIAAISGGIWYIDHRGYQRGIAEMKAEADAANLKAAQDYIERLKSAGEQHDKDQATITRLAAAARGVRVHIPTCPAAAGAENPDGGSGVFSERVDAEFVRFQTEVGQLVERCDQLNIDAIRANAVR